MDENPERDDDKPTPLWLRLCATVVGAILTGVGAVVVLFLAALLGASATRGTNVTALFVVFCFVGAFLGFLLPRQTLNSLWIFLPGFDDQT